MGLRVRQWRCLAAATVLLTIAAAGGCGSERTFSAQEFADEVNAQGVEFQLGERLFSDDPDKEVYAVELEQLANLPGAGGHTGGSLEVHEDSEAAGGSFGDCEASADLLCYQASNVVVVLEGGGVEAQRLGVAIERLAEE